MFGPGSPIDIATEPPGFTPATRIGRSFGARLVRAALLSAATALLVAIVASLADHASLRTDAHPPRAPARAHGGLTMLPAGAQGAVSSAIGADDPAYRARALGHGRFLARSAGISATFDSRGVSVAAGATRLRMEPVSVSAAGAPRVRLTPRAPSARANEVEYAYPSLRAWYRNGPAGIEQGFVLTRPPLAASRHSGSAGLDIDLTIALRSNAGSGVSRDGQSVTFTRAGSAALRLGSLLVTDASGRALPSRFVLSGGELNLRFDAAGARYPITVDPLLKQGTRLTGVGESGQGQLGISVAVSEDGTTALVGAPHDNSFAGAAWVFVRDGATWTQQGPKLVAGGPAESTGCTEEPDFNGLEESECGFGTSVAISGDGNTALVGSPRDNGLKGGAWVFTRSGNVWTREPQELFGLGETGEAHFGKSVALSGDGTIALVAGPYDNNGHGAVWSYKRTGGGWSLMGEEKITPSEEVGASFFGRGLAISPDGAAMLVGGPGDSGYAGAAWFYTRSGSGWIQKAKITGGEEAGAARFGFAVALSESGETALVGGPRDSGGTGAAWLFTRAGDTLAQEGAKLAGPEEIGEGFFGRALAISASGRLALVGAPRDNNGYGAAWVLTRSSAGVNSEKFSAEVKGQFGASVALSADGNVPLFGAPLAERKAGVAWAGLPPALVSSVAPSSGPAAGGTSVTISGAGFTDVSGVYFGETAAAYEVRSPTSIVAVSPPDGPGGVVDVTVVTAHGSSPTGPADRFTYVPPEGEISSGDGSDAGGESSGEGSEALAYNGAGAGRCRFKLVSKKVRVLSRGRAAPRLRRVGSGRCAGRLTLSVRVRVHGSHKHFKLLSIGSTRFVISGTRTVTVSVRLNAFGRSLLRAGHGQASASLVVVPSAPAAHAQTSAVHLRAGR